MNRATSWAVLATATLLAAGCQSKITQCNAFIGEANKSQESFKKIEESIGSPEALKQSLGQIEEATKKVEGVKLKDENLLAFQKRYVEGLRGVAVALNSIASLGADPSKVTQLEKAGKDIEKLGDQETKLVNEINTYCSGNP